MDSLRHNKLRWKCRRGLLELDLVLEKYLQQHSYDPELDEFLELQDNDLWDIVSGRSDRFDARHGGIVARLRAV
jgi:succinate dehydrogenase flavin-adding protein (antitoxin of CptAB toxin-antitoxin module)